MEKKRVHYRKKLFALSFVIVLIVPLYGETEIDLGVNLGYRQLKDSELSETYGDGYVYNLSVKYFPLPQYGVELCYEGGYKKNAPVGLYQEDSTLSVSGLQLAGVYRYPVGKIVPCFKFGVGYFSYRQDIESAFVRFHVDHHKWTTVVGGGINIRLFSQLFFSAEVKYIPLKVQPFDIQVDLGGMRYLVGLGWELPL